MISLSNILLFALIPVATMLIGRSIAIFKQPSGNVRSSTLLNNLSHGAMEIVLSFGLAALLFLVTEELLKEAHEEKETVWHTAAIFGGFLLFMIIGMYAKMLNY